MKQAHLFISGYVQRVGFRHFVKTEAGKLGLIGWVRNTADNKVEAVFKGDKDQIKKIIELCKKGPFLSGVKNVEVKREEADKTLEFFEIRI